MKIGLYNLEPKYINIALEKIRAYYTLHGHVVENCSPLEASNYDVVYCSSLFDWSDKKYVSASMIKGGTGFDLTTKLPKEIDAVELKINRGFSSRGCPNKCKFCVVPQKEGDIYVVCDVLSLWDGKSKLVTLYDNNILALPQHFELNTKQAIENKITLDYNQGLDHRLLTSDIVELMKKVSHVEYRFAFDNPHSIASVEYAIDLLQSKGINRSLWYVLCGFDTTFEQDLFRLNYLKSRNQNAFVQRFKSKNKIANPKLTALARWANQHHIFQGMTWNEFLKRSDNPDYYREFLVS
ncbi:MAG: hypothetical protein WC389_12930 [Lutibacter sp.]|jgi:hypothetical protein